MAANTTKGTATPMPTFAPVDRPLLAVDVDSAELAVEVAKPAPEVAGTSEAEAGDDDDDDGDGVMEAGADDVERSEALYLTWMGDAHRAALAPYNCVAVSAVGSPVT